jgi:hypothetical protein
MEPEHLPPLSRGALLPSRSGTGATLRLHLNHQASGTPYLGAAAGLCWLLGPSGAVGREGSAVVARLL